MNNRREFITLLSSAAAAWPLAVRAQQPPVPVIGFLGMNPASGYASRLDGLRSGLRDAGYIDGHNVAIAFLWADDPTELPRLAAELVRRDVAVIICSRNTATGAAKAATAKIPIVFSGADDPVKLGFVSSFNRPGGNMTGVSLISGTLGAKRLELLRQLVPNPTTIALLTNPKNPAESGRDVQAAAQAIGQRTLVLRASTKGEIEEAFAALAREKADAILVNADALFTAEREILAGLAVRYRVPAMYPWREFAEAGGLVSYGTSLSYGYRQIGIYAGRILKGEKPAELPVIQPTAFELVINLKTAKALGLAIPDKLLALSDEVIE
jgi:putative tryptophan/tyrosine transport system substrate-binding protein